MIHETFKEYGLESLIIVSFSIIIYWINYLYTDDQQQLNLNAKHYIVYILVLFFIPISLYTFDRYSPSIGENLRGGMGWLLGGSLIYVLNVSTIVPMVGRSARVKLSKV